MFLIVGRVGDLVQMTPDGGLRLIGLCPNNGVEPVASFADVSVPSEEIYGAGAEAQELRHPRVVVVVLG